MANTNRRTFLHKLAGLTGAAAATPFWNTLAGKNFRQTLSDYENVPADMLAQDELFWYQIKQAYTVSPNVINLNNGGVCPQPRVVQEAVERYNRLSNEAPSYYMWQILDQGREPLRANLATLAGCDAEEIAINRNASEALETIIFGLRLQPGDEVVLTKQDYPNMICAWKQRAQREGIVLKWIDLQLPSEDKSYLVQSFVNTFTARTKVVQLTHMINWIGQILPVADIAKAARQRGIAVLVDAAHTFAHFDYRISDLACDYLGTSLHKWLCAPFGSGMLYVRREKIKDLYPLFGAPDPESDDIRKFEHLGTRSFAIEQAIGEAINFHEMISIQRKQARLHYLKNYWATRALELPGVQVKTSLHPDWGCALALLSIKGKTPAEVSSYLFNKYRIHTTSIEWENISGVRITPNVYTTTQELDRLVQAIRQLAAS